jgi:hypothetical protein
MLQRILKNGETQISVRVVSYQEVLPLKQQDYFLLRENTSQQNEI